MYPAATTSSNKKIQLYKQNMWHFLKSFLASVSWISIIACTPNGGGDYTSPTGYDFSNPTTVNLNTHLDEISGIVYYPKDTSVFAVNDELGVLYKIYLRDEIMIETWVFSNSADYEDLALVDSTFFALHSNGNVTRFRFNSANDMDTEECLIPLTSKNEFETLYYDESLRKLVLVCKDCKGEKGKKVSAYTLDPITCQFDPMPSFTIDGAAVLAKQEKGENTFKPSAASIHPITGQVYLVSAVNKVLVITDRQGVVKEVYPLDPARFKQPEGIYFSPGGDMLISNESAEIGAANILIFKYKPKDS